MINNHRFPTTDQEFFKHLNAALEHANSALGVLKRNGEIPSDVRLAWPPEVPGKYCGTMIYHLAAMIKHVYRVYNGLNESRDVKEIEGW